MRTFSMSSVPQLTARLQAFANQNGFPDTLPNLYEPCQYMMGLGGKRMRPMLALLACELFTEDAAAALPVAWAVEVFHNFTLVHDDIMDAAPLRRGQPTVHTRWNLNTGILSGDVMLIRAYELLTQVPDAALQQQLLRIFNRVAREVCEGQQMDMDFECRSEVSVQDYIRMIELKTAVLLGGALEMGALCGGGSLTDAAHLYAFGRLAGIAFQIQDDILDTYGDPAAFGKQVGGDIVQNKKTLLVLKALEMADATDQQALRQWLNTPTEDAAAKVIAVKALFDRHGVRAAVQAEKERFERAAFAHLDAVSVSALRKAALQQMVTDLFVRTF